MAGHPGSFKTVNFNITHAGLDKYTIHFIGSIGKKMTVSICGVLLVQILLDWLQ
jgi:hypothetical protein